MSPQDLELPLLEYDDEQDVATDQDNSGPGPRDQNNENVRAKKNNSGPGPRDQNNENLCAVTPTSREYNNENMHDTSEAQYQTHNTTREAKTHSGKKTTAKTHSGKKTTKSMTYREALLGIDNSESSSDF